MLLAIQEAMLPGRSTQDRLNAARELGLDGIEVSGLGLGERIYELAEALNNTGLRVAAVNMGRQADYLMADPAQREAGIDRLRQAMANAVDLMAPQVIFVPHYGPTSLPDLTPHRSANELESELMIWLLRTVSDLAYALGVTLSMQPINRYESQFMNTCAQARRYLAEIKDHPHVRIAASLFDMALEEADYLASLKEMGERCSYLQISDSNDRLPGQGLIDYGALADTLRSMNYDGWLTLRCQHNPEDPEASLRIRDALPGSMALLREAGLWAGPAQG